MAKASSAELMTLTPKQVANCITAFINKPVAKRRVPFIWGPPGISKSAIALQCATAANIAFADVRLSQMDPTDLRGMPFRVEENGVTTGVAWSPPLVLPRDLDIARVMQIEAIETKISFASLNPKGTNGIHYVKKPIIEVASVDRNLTAEIISETADHFTVVLKDADGNPAAGKVHYKVTGKAEALVAFEEMNSAPPSVLAAAYQIILDRRQGEYIVPEGVMMMAMGNRETDKGVTFNMPTPLCNRLIHLQMKEHFPDWFEWAVKNDIHPSVVGYLSNFKSKLFNFEPSSAEKAFATPRSWQFVSDIMEDSDGVPAVELNAQITGAIGMGLGAEFNAFRKRTIELPKPEDVLEGRVTKFELSNKDGAVSLQYALTTSLCYELRRNNEALKEKGIGNKSKDKERVNWYKQYDNVLKFWMNNFSPEVCVMGMRIGVAVHDFPIDENIMTSFERFVEQYAPLMGEGS